VNISSTMDRMVGRGLLVYGTVKAALSHMTRLLAADLAPRVRVNAIAPGVVETDGLKAALTDEVRAQVTAATPLHRLASVDDIAAAAVWLASRLRALSPAQSSESTEEPRRQPSPTRSPTCKDFKADLASDRPGPPPAAAGLSAA
jgi:NAD(P)-dependent dehydrogenase (short-subunit alcohol dehydrogenase family)